MLINFRPLFIGRLPIKMDFRLIKKKSKKVSIDFRPIKMERKLISIGSRPRKMDFRAMPT